MKRCQGVAKSKQRQWQSTQISMRQEKPLLGNHHSPVSFVASDTMRHHATPFARFGSQISQEFSTS
jgi:hypothetical protein